MRNRLTKFANDEIIVDLADELNITEERVREVVKAQSDFTKKAIRRGGFESVMYPYLGKFKTNVRTVVGYSRYAGRGKKRKRTLKEQEG